MNPVHFQEAPKCFPDQRGFDQWLMLARASGILDVFPHARAYAIALEVQHATGDYAAQLQRSYVQAANRASHYGQREAPYCVDCTQCYRDKMRGEGRCAHPGTRFRISESDDGKSFEVIGERVAP